MILLFGAGGQFGREFLAMAERKGVAVTGRSRADADIADPGMVARAIAEVRPEVIVNAAGYTDVDRSESEPDAAMRANAEGPAVLAAAAARAGVPLVHLSTDYVFNGSKAGAYREDDTVAPLGVYGRSKAEGEMMIRRLNSSHVIVRTAWLYGVYGRNFLKTVLLLAEERDALRIVDDQRGSPTATADLALAVLAVASQLNSGETCWGTFHFAGIGATTWHGFATRIVECQALFTRHRPAVLPIATAEYPTTARRPANSVLDSAQFEATFGFRARRWEEAVDQTVRELLSREAAA